MAGAKDYCGEVEDPDPIPVRRFPVREGAESTRGIRIRPAARAFYDAKLATTLEPRLLDAARTVSFAISDMRDALMEERRVMRAFWNRNPSARAKVGAFAGVIGGVELADFLFPRNVTQALQTSMLQNAVGAGKFIMVTAAACYGIAWIARQHASDAMHPAAVAGLCAAGAAGVRCVLG